jgi:hypothetical protein
LFISFVFDCIRQGEEKKVPKYFGKNPVGWKETLVFLKNWCKVPG